MCDTPASLLFLLQCQSLRLSTSARLKNNTLWSHDCHVILATPTYPGGLVVVPLDEEEPGASRGPREEQQLEQGEEEGNCKQDPPAIELLVGPP